MTRTLSLKRETLAELASDELAMVGGGGVAATGFSCPFVFCISNDISCLACLTDDCV